MRKIKFITSNIHKVKELSNFFINTEIDIIHHNMKYIELQADTCQQVVNASAAQLQSIINGDFLIEDSGLTIVALDKFPGPYSSYVYQTLGWKGILELMNSQNNRLAYFTSIIALIENENLITFEGRCDGIISYSGKGNDGFGFDPIFVPNAKQKTSDPKQLATNGVTFGEMPLKDKNKISHRSKSMKLLKKYLIS